MKEYYWRLSPLNGTNVLRLKFYEVGLRWPDGSDTLHYVEADCFGTAVEAALKQNGGETSLENPATVLHVLPH